jgi:hypothetical protein
MGIAAIGFFGALAAMAAGPAVLRVAPATGAAGGQASVAIILDAGAERPVAALEWMLSAPSGHGIEALPPKASPSATAAGKSLSCTGKWKKGATEYQWKCILAGGAGPVPAGVIATAPFRFAAQVRPGSHHLSLERVKAVDRLAHAVPLGTAPGKLVVQ